MSYNYKLCEQNSINDLRASKQKQEMFQLFILTFIYIV